MDGSIGTIQTSECVFDGDEAGAERTHSFPFLKAIFQGVVADLEGLSMIVIESKQVLDGTCFFDEFIY